MTLLRDPEHGCPWDVRQTFESIAPYTIEEAYEVADAIDRRDLTALKEELGDLLLQVIFHAQMASEIGAFGFDDVVSTICNKLVRRHPHVFGGERIGSAEARTEAWERHKADEQRVKAETDGLPTESYESVLDVVTVALPALVRAAKLQKRAALVGFDWPSPESVLAKVSEETAELLDEFQGDANAERLQDEVGDLLFTCVNIARKLNINPETALRRANAKFERRFRIMEGWLAAAGRRPQDATLDELDALWERAKATE